MAEVYLGVGIDASGAQQGAAQYDSAAKKVTDGAKKATKENEALTKQIKEAQKVIQLQQKQLDSVGGALDQYKMALGQARLAVSQKQKQIDSIKQALMQYENALRASEKAVRDQGKEIESLKQKLEDSNNKIKESQKTWEGYKSQINNTLLVVKAFAAATAALAVREISNFTQELSNARAMTGASGEDMDRLSKVIRELGASTVFSAAEVAKAAAELGKAGFNTQEIMTALPATLDLASAATIGIAEASKITANVMNGFGLSTKDVGRAADILGAIAINSATDVSGLGEAMKYAGPPSKMLGISLETTAAAMATMAQNGLDGGQAGRNFASMLFALLKPSGEAKKAIKELKISLDDVNPSMNKIEDIIKRFTKANIDATQAAIIFGAEGFRAFSALSTSPEIFEKMTQVIGKADGSLRKISQIKLDNIAGDFERLTGGLSETANAVGAAGLEGSLRGYLQTATQWIESLNKSINAIANNRKELAELVEFLKIVSYSIAAIVALNFAAWLYGAATAAWALVTAVAALNAVGLVVYGSLAGIILYLDNMKTETTRLEEETRKQEEALLDLPGAYGTAARAGRVHMLELQLATMRTTDQIKQDIKALEAVMGDAEKRMNIARNRFPGGAPAGMEDSGSMANLAGQADTARISQATAELKRRADIEAEIAELKNTQYYWSAMANKEVRDGLRGATDYADKITKGMLGLAGGFSVGPLPKGKTPDVNDGRGSGSGEKKKESFIVGELEKLKLQLELTKNLGASEADLYRIRLNDEALREAKEAGLKRITDTMKNQINTAVALFTEENKLKESYETQKKMTDSLKEKLKTSEAAVTAAQNLGASEAELLRINLEAQATEAARKAGLQGISAEWQTMIDKIVALAAIQKETKDNFETGEKQKKYIEDLNKAFEAEKQRAALLKEYGKNLSEVSLQMEIYNALKEKNVAVGSKEASVIEKQIRDTKALKKANDDNTEATKKAEEASKKWAAEMKDAFKDAIMNSKNLGDALSNLANRVQDMLVNKALDSLLGGMFKSIGFAKGAAFQAGGVTAFASGVIVSQPSFFPMSGNRTGLMGEAGPEAIMPLTRTSSGDLGVRAIGGGDTTVIAPVVNITVSGGSEEQNNDAATKVSAAVRDAIDDVVMNVLLREKRPGGSLT